MPFRMIVTDLDGTLISSRQEVSPRNLAALASWAERGACICVATGRHPASALQVTACFPFPYILIALNGAVVIDQPSGRIRSRRFMSPDKTRATLAVLERLGLDRRRDVLTLDTWYVSHVEDDVSTRTQRLGLALRVIPEPCDVAAAKVMVQVPRNKSREILAQARALLPEMTVVLSTPSLLEIMGPGVSKGSSVLGLAGELDISPEAIIAFGDQLNDLDLLEVAGCGVAMANADEELKRVADRVTLRHDDDGVALVLEELLPAS